MERRYDEMRGTHMVNALESMTGNDLPKIVRDELIKGADELDLVRSGLDDTMRLAYQEISKERQDNAQIQDFRTAAYAVSIRKIARSYLDIGVY